MTPNPDEYLSIEDWIKWRWPNVELNEWQARVLKEFSDHRGRGSGKTFLLRILMDYEMYEGDADAVVITANTMTRYGVVLEHMEHPFPVSYEKLYMPGLSSGDGATPTK